MLRADVQRFRRGHAAYHLPGAYGYPAAVKTQTVRDKLRQTRQQASAADQEHRLRSRSVRTEYLGADGIRKLLFRRKQQPCDLLPGYSAVVEKNIRVLGLRVGAGLDALRFVELNEKLLHQRFGHFIAGYRSHSVGDYAAVP